MPADKNGDDQFYEHECGAGEIDDLEPKRDPGQIGSPVHMANKPEFKRVGASTYACTVCPNFKDEITGKMNAGQLRKHLDARLAQHVQQYHSGEDNSMGGTPKTAE